MGKRSWPVRTNAEFIDVVRAGAVCRGHMKSCWQVPRWRYALQLQRDNRLKRPCCASCSCRGLSKDHARFRATKHLQWPYGFVSTPSRPTQEDILVGYVLSLAKNRTASVHIYWPRSSLLLYQCTGGFSPGLKWNKSRSFAWRAVFAKGSQVIALTLHRSN